MISIRLTDTMMTKVVIYRRLKHTHIFLIKQDTWVEVVGGLVVSPALSSRWMSSDIRLVWLVTFQHCDPFDPLVSLMALMAFIATDFFDLLNLI